MFTGREFYHGPQSDRGRRGVAPCAGIARALYAEARVNRVILRGSPRMPEHVCELEHLAPTVLRLIDFRRAGIMAERFEVTAILYDGAYSATYVGLERSCPLMSDTEKRLSPERFPS